MSDRVVITGMGVLCPVAGSPGELARRLAIGTSGVRLHRDILPEGPIWAGLIPEVDPVGSRSRHDHHELDRTAQFAIAAASQAMADSGLPIGPGPVMDGIGLVLGTSHGGRSQLDHFVEHRATLSRPEAASWVLIAAAHQSQTAAVSRALGVRGPSLTLSNACSSSGAAVATAFELIRSGKCRAALAGGADAFSKLTFAGFRALGAMADGPCGPFSDRIGLSLGEGAAFVVLEDAEHAADRGARAHAELLGYGLTWDAYHVTAPEPSGDGMFRALAAAARRAGVGPGDIDYINAHGTGTRSNDVAETLALKRFLGPEAAHTPVSGSKSFTGHMLGASSVVGLIVGVLGMNHDLIPPTINFEAPRAGCDLDYVPNRARPGKIRHFLAQSAAFGGANAVLLGGRARATPGRPAPRRAVDEVVVTGVGVVSPIGCGVGAFLDSLRAGRSGIGPLERFVPAGPSARHAALVRDFRPRAILPSLNLRRVDRVVEYAVVAAGLALREAALEPGPEESGRVGVVVGTTRGAAASFEKYLDSVAGPCWTKASAVHFPNLVMSSIGGQISNALGLKGIASTLVGGVTAGLHALAHALELLRGDASADAVVVVAADELSPLYFGLQDELGWLAPGVSPDGRTPHLDVYAPDAPGMILGEGGVAIVLEQAGVARSRGVRAMARIAGYGLSTDDSGLDPGGIGLGRAASEALEESGTDPGELDLIYGHGRGLPGYDLAEARAFARLLDGRAVPVGCVNPSTGVAEAASGLFSVAAATLGMVRGEAYPVSGLRSDVADRPGLALVRGAIRAGRYAKTLVAGGTDSGNHAAIVLIRDDEGAGQP